MLQDFYALDRMECLEYLPTSWRAPGRIFPSSIDPVFAPCRPHVHTGEYGVSEYLFRAAREILAGVRICEHPRIVAALEAARAFCNSLAPNRWDSMRNTRDPQQP
jgi:hypothetical protein